jgi:hypothetical protein
MCFLNGAIIDIGARETAPKALPDARRCR